MSGSYEIVETMRSVPITWHNRGVRRGHARPVGPLLLTLTPLSEILKKLAGICSYDRADARPRTASRFVRYSCVIGNHRAYRAAPATTPPRAHLGR